MKSRISRRTFLRNIGIGAGAAAWTLSSAQTRSLAAAVSGSGASLGRLANQTFTYWVPLASNVSASLKSFGEMLCYQELEKRTNVHIDFQHVSDQGAATEEQFNLLVASGQYPDIIERNWLTAAGGPSKYLKD